MRAARTAIVPSGTRRRLPARATAAAALLVALASYPLPLHAAEEADEPTPSTPDRIQQRASDMLFAPVRWVDHLFGESIGNQEVNRSYLRVIGTARWRERSRPEYRPSTQLKLDFRKTQRRVSLLIAGRPDDEPDDLTDRPDDAAPLDVPAEDDQNNSFIGLNGRLIDWVRSRLDARSGFKAGWHPFGQLRYRQDVPVGRRWLVRLTQTGQWIHDDGFSASTRVELDRPIGRALVRVTTRGLIEESDGFDWTAGASFYTPVTRRLSLSLDASMAGVTEPETIVLQHRTASRLRWELHRWWFIEAEPAVTWPIEDGRRPTPGVKLRTDVIIGRLR